MKRLILIISSTLLLSACTSEQKNKIETDTTDTLELVEPTEVATNLSQQDSIKATGTQVLTFLIPLQQKS